MDAELLPGITEPVATSGAYRMNVNRFYNWAMMGARFIHAQNPVVAIKGGLARPMETCLGIPLRPG